MIRASSINAVAANRTSLNTGTISLWTPRNTGEDKFATSRSPNNNKIQIPFATPRFHQKRHFGKSPAGGNYRGVEVLTRLPSLYTGKAQHGSSQPNPKGQQQASPGHGTSESHSHPEPLPLLYGSKTRRVKQQPQVLSPTHEEPQQLPPDIDEESNDRQAKLEVEKPAQQQEEERSIPIAYFPREGSCRLQSARVEDADARSCDMRHPNQTVAYTRAGDYIRDNELMSSEKVRRIWHWIDSLDLDDGRQLFVYDASVRWFVNPGRQP